MVRLLPRDLGVSKEALEVSIPQWCDCCYICQVSELLDNLKVSIPQWCDCCSNTCLTKLLTNSVSIPQWCDCCLVQPRLQGLQIVFQSHNGAIAAAGLAADSLSEIGFNPTMVRLLPFSLESLVREYLPFQSHNGAIAACWVNLVLTPPVLVSIPQWCDCCRSAAASAVKPLKKFQSHNGAIAAARIGLQPPCIPVFQSHNGAIAAKRRR